MFFVTDDKKVGKKVEKAAICQVDVGGAICGIRLIQNYSTTGILRGHLKVQHLKAWVTFNEARNHLESEKRGAMSFISEDLDVKVKGKQQWKLSILLFLRSSGNNLNTGHFIRCSDHDLNGGLVKSQEFRLLCFSNGRCSGSSW